MKKNGFTMIELLVTMAILAIVAVIAIPNASIWMANHRAKAGVNQIYGSIQKARSIAIKENRDAAVTFVAGVCYMDGQAITLPDRVTLSASTFPVGGLVWNGQAIPNIGTDGTVNVGNAQRTYQVTVSASGVIRSQLL